MRSLILSLITLATLTASETLPEGFLRNSPVFRGPLGIGLAPEGSYRTAWTADDLLWRVDIDLPGWSAPLIWEDRVIITAADSDDRAVICLSLATGEELWRSNIPLGDTGDADLEIDSMDARWDRILFAAATPATNGRQVFAPFSTGQMVALDLTTGEQQWIVSLGPAGPNTFGLTNSLLLYRDLVITAFEGDEQYIAAFKAESGEQVWKSERKSATWSSPLLLTTPNGTDMVVLLGDPDLSAWNPATGEQLWTIDILSDTPQYAVGPTAIHSEGRIFVNSENAGIYAVNAETGGKLWELEDLDCGFPDGTSMLVHQGRVYQFHEECIAVLNAETGELIKEDFLDDVATYASPMIIGDNLYLITFGGVLVVPADPELEFNVIGKGFLAGSIDASPAAAHGHLVFRGDNVVFAVGAP